MLDKLVQKRLRLKNYKEYLNSSCWHNTKQRFYKSKLAKRDSKGNLCCGHCRRNDIVLHLHHRTYKRVGKERLSDLELVCELCHAFIHELAFKYNISIIKATNKARKLTASSKATEK